MPPVTFKSQYDGAKVNLKASAQQAQSVSTGKVLSDRSRPTSTPTTPSCSSRPTRTVKNKSTKGKSEPRYYRLKLTMTPTRAVSGSCPTCSS